MSVRFSIAKLVLKLAGMKKMFGLPEEELLAKVGKFNVGRDFAVPTDKACVYTDIKVGEHDHCLKMQPNGSHNDKALLYLFGGGMVLGPDADDRKAGCKLGFSCGMDVWMPWYPLYPKYNMEDAAEMVLESYRQMLKEYKPENIAFCGFSSGASLSIATCLHNLRQENPVPNPACILANSPGTIPHCDEEWQEMQRLGEKDIMIDPNFMEVMKSVMCGDGKAPEYLIYTSAADYTGMPPIHFWWGSDEVLLAEKPYYAEACEKAGVNYTTVVGEGMCHCYGMLDIYPEGKAAQNEMREYLNKLGKKS